MQETTQTKTIYTTRPDNLRQPREERVYDLLDRLAIPFARVDHEATATIEACTEIEQILGIEVRKNLFLTNSRRDTYYLLVLPGSKQLVTRELAHQIGSTRLSFAGEDKLLDYLDIHPGSVSILGLMNDRENRVRLLIDRAVTESDYFGCHPCVNTTSLKIKTSDILEKFLPAIGHTPLFVEI